MVVTDLLHTALERWDSGRLTAHAVGSTNVAGLRSGRDIERGAMLGEGSVYAQGNSGRGRAWEDLRSAQSARRAAGARDGATGYGVRTRQIQRRERRY